GSRRNRPPRRVERRRGGRSKPHGNTRSPKELSSNSPPERAKQRHDGPNRPRLAGALGSKRHPTKAPNVRLQNRPLPNLQLALPPATCDLPPGRRSQRPQNRLL